MEWVILDGVKDDTGVGQYLSAYAEARQMPVRRFVLADMTLAPCRGDFECWTKTPGRCRTRDGAEDIARAVHEASLVVFLSPICFGGYSAALKKAVDRLIGLVHPCFHDRDGLTRHQPRYARYAPMLFIGLADPPDEDAGRTFAELAAGNAVNLMAPGFVVCTLSMRANDWSATLDAALSRVLNGDLDPPVTVPAANDLLAVCRAEASAIRAVSAPRRVVVLVGSARPKGTSTSEWLADRMIAGLEAAGFRVTKVHASQFIKRGRAADQALGEILAAELLVVAAPIYVDGLPALVVSALEQLAVRLEDGSHVLARVVGLLNCGYPEAIHNRVAMRLLRHFAQQTRLRWAGGLALGGGEALQGNLRAYAALVRPNVVGALRQAADALAQGDTVPARAAHAMAKPWLPARLYRWLAGLRWKRVARAHGLGVEQLDARPWETVTQAPGQG